MFRATRRGAAAPQLALKVLGLGSGASAKEIKFAFRAMALRWHPDVNPDPDARQRFEEAKSAFECLGGSRHVDKSSSSVDMAARMAGWPPWYTPEADERLRRGLAPDDEEEEDPWMAWLADDFGLRRGALLASSPIIHRGALNELVVLLLNIGGRGARGVVLNAGASGCGGPVSHGEETTVLHACRGVANGGPIQDGHNVYVEENLTPDNADDLCARLVASGAGPHVVLHGRLGWSPGQLQYEVGNGLWSVHHWGANTSSWWLREGHTLAKRELWERARARLPTTS